MSHVSTFPQFVPARVLAALERLRGKIWSPVETAVVIAGGPVTEAARPWADARHGPWQEVRPPHHWGTLYARRWFRLTWSSAAGAEPLYLAWRDQAEATLYIDGKAFYGFDVAHRVAPLPTGTGEAWIDATCVQSAIWHPEASGLDAAGSRLDGATLLRRDDAAWEAYHDLLVLHELVLEELQAAGVSAAALTSRPGVRPPLPVLPVHVRQRLAGLEVAVDALDRGGVAAMRRALRPLYREYPAAPRTGRAVLVGHAHIDLVWLWPERVGEDKAVHTFATADRLMARYPEFRFSYSQPASYRAVARREPELAARVKRRLREGRWELAGQAWVESDTLLPTGEALLRGLELGRTAAAEIGAPAGRVLWLPDVFGYAACLPQVMRLAGFDRFFTNKITWNRVTAFPLASFRWRAPDGTEVLAHVSHEKQQFYNGTATARELRAAVESNPQAAVHDAVLVPTGYGDGGGGPTEEMCERARRMRSLLGLPATAWGRVEDFFEELAPRTRELPVWDGELYLEYHRGTYTTHGDLKAAYRAAERALQTWEAARCATGGGPVPVEPWQRVVFAQFHDALPGSSVREVYAEMVPELRAIATDVAARAAAELAAKRGAAASLFNPLARPARVVHDGEVLELPPLAGMAVATAPRVAVGRVRAGGRRLESERVRATFDAAGRIARLVIDGRAVPLAGPAGGLVVYPDEPHAFDAWELDEATLRLGEPLAGRARVEVAGDGGVVGEVAFTRAAPEGGRATTRYRLVAGASYLEIHYELDWRRPRALVKAVFPTTLAGAAARFGGPFGSVLRDRRAGRPAHEAQWEVPGSRWAAVRDDAETDGLYVITEAKYGFGGRDGTLDVSLLRSAMVTGESGRSAAVRMGRRTPAGGPLYADLGPQVARVAIGRHAAGLPREEQPAAVADRLFTPPVAYTGPATAAALLGCEGGESWQPAWARPLGRGRWLLRGHETLGCAGAVWLRLAPGWRAIEEGTGRELRGGRLDFGAYAVTSTVVERAARA